MTTRVNVERQLSEAAERIRRNDTRLAKKLDSLAQHKETQSKSRMAQQIIVVKMLQGKKFKLADIKPWVEPLVEREEISLGFTIWALVNRDLVKVVAPGTYQINRRTR